MADQKTASGTRSAGPPFELGIVEPTDAPTGAEGDSWCRYTITQGPNTITGYRQGSVTAVKKAVLAEVAEMNERRGGQKGRVHIKLSKEFLWLNYLIMEIILFKRIICNCSLNSAF